MHINKITLSTRELQTALQEFCERNGFPNVGRVCVESHGKEIIEVVMEPDGLVTTLDVIRHRVQS